VCTRAPRDSPLPPASNPPSQPSPFLQGLRCLLLSHTEVLQLMAVLEVEVLLPLLLVLLEVVQVL